MCNGCVLNVSSYIAGCHSVSQRFVYNNILVSYWTVARDMRYFKNILKLFCIQPI